MSVDVELPPGWALEALGQFTQRRGTSVDPAKFKDERFELYSIPGFDTGAPEDQIGAEIGSSKQLVRAGSVLLSKINPRINRAWLVGPDVGRRKIASTEWIVFPEDERLDGEYLKYFLQQGAVRNFLATNVSGVGGSLMRVKASTLADYPIAIAPIREQRRIVEKIDTLFAELDKGEESLRQVQTLLARYRQSVLKAAVTGELTADWRAERAGKLEHGRDLLERILQTRRDSWKGRGKYKNPALPDLKDPPALPEGWVWGSLDALIEEGPSNGVSPKETTDPSGALSFKLTATTSGKFLINEDTIKRVGIQLEEDSQYWLKANDVLIQRGNTIDYVGTAAIFPGPDQTYIYPDLMMRIRFAEPVLAQWAVTWINFEYAKRHFRRLATGTAGNMPKINATTLRSLPVPLPSMEEIRRILAILHGHEQGVGATLQLTSDGQIRSRALRQSILKDAFSGRLVPQDPNEEPASELLARIRAARDDRKKK